MDRMRAVSSIWSATRSTTTGFMRPLRASAFFVAMMSAQHGPTSLMDSPEPGNPRGRAHEQGGVAAVVNDQFGPTTCRPWPRNSKSRPVPPSTPRGSRPSRRRPAHPAALGGAVGPTTTAAAAWSWVEKMLQRPAHLGAEAPASRSAPRSARSCAASRRRARREGLGVGVLARAAPSGRASRARRGGSPCGRTRRARGRRREVDAAPLLETAAGRVRSLRCRGSWS